MSPSVFRRAAAALSLLLYVGCSSADPSAAEVAQAPQDGGNVVPTVTLVEGGTAPVALPDFESPAELEQAIVAFAECVEQSFPIVITFRTDPFFGLATEVGSQRQEDGELVDRVVSSCQAQLDLDRRMNLYQVEHPLSPADEQALVDEFVACAATVSPEISDLLSEADLDTYESVLEFERQLDPSVTGLAVAVAVAVSDCQRAMTGPERLFVEGHPWFNR